MLHMDKLDSLKSIQKDSPKDTKKTNDLLDVAVTSLMEAKREDELANETFIKSFYKSYQISWQCNISVGSWNTRKTKR